MSVTYLDPADVVDVIVNRAAPIYGRNVDGYGSKIPTRFMLRLQDGRARRVYVMQYANSGSCYVVVGGEDRFLPSDLEHDMMAAAARQDGGAS
jgi:hypothetical protein